jgi:hypothetical protein
MAAERKLKVSFDEPERGWIAITMIADDGRFMLVPSHVPYDSVAELAQALNKILEGYSEAVVRWNEEPAEYEFVFRVSEGHLNLDVYEVTTAQGGIRRNSVFNFIGPRDQSLIAFWRALRELQGRWDPSEYERRWKEPFPTREMEVLTQGMKALKHG